MKFSDKIIANIPCRVVNLTGKEFGKLTVVGFVGIKKHAARWLCNCRCGKQTVVASNSLRRGATRSCGCYMREYIRKKNSGMFTKGDPRVYTPPKGTRMSPNTEFKPGRMPDGFRGYGKPRETKHGNRRTEIVVTLPDKKRIGVARGKEYCRAKVTTYSRYAYCKYHGLAIDDIFGKIVYCIDGNHKNHSKENLELITRAELLRRNRGG